MRKPLKPVIQVGLILAGTAVLLGGIAGIRALTAPPLPDLSTVKAEAHAVMEPVAELLSAATTRDWGKGSLLTCGDMFKPGSSDTAGVTYTGHWGFRMPEGFDGEAFIDGLPAALGDDYVDQTDTDPITDIPYVDLRHVESGLVVSVTSVTDHDTGEPIIDVLTFSNCAKDPDTDE
ncbi:hypothetical protein ASD56_03135 [Microbacterium sp. Root166]|uniref:hypothetical protein n=1 Tax=Microbacterium sp. Root166 TaxID=1736478 RepID=UPI000701895F|nr:hypothetical protein [Microbacterium sp. Root166]KQZ85354.1 hypothetical protein ASD56_03135 [Microbacterium sp. Root166]